MDINYGDSNSPELLYKAALKKSIPSERKRLPMVKNWETLPDVILFPSEILFPNLQKGGTDYELPCKQVYRVHRFPVRTSL